VIGLCLAACALVVPYQAGPALAAGSSPAPPDQGVELSVDGTHWSHDLVVDLFGPDLVWVPGDIATATVYVRTSCPLAEGTADVQVAGPPGVLDVLTRVYAGQWTSSPSSFAVASGEVAPVEVQVTYDPQAGDSTQLTELALSVVVTARCCEPQPSPDPVVTGVPTTSPTGHLGDDPDDPGGAVLAAPGHPLATTGAAVAKTAVVVLVLVIAGAGLASLRARVASGGRPDA